ATPEMAQPERIVAVHEDASMVEPVRCPHDTSLAVDLLRIFPGETIALCHSWSVAETGDLPSLLVGICGVAQSITEKIEGEDHQHHRYHGQHEPRIEGDHVDVLRLGQQHSPAGDGRPQPEAEEAERSLAEDHRRDRDGRGGDEMAHEAGNEVAADDA